MACGYLGLGFTRKDSAVAILPHNAERLTMQIGAAYAGVNLYVIPTASLVSGEVTSETIAEVLKVSQAKGIVAGHGSNLVGNVRTAVGGVMELKAAELRGDMYQSDPLEVPAYPTLRYCIHTGAAKETGMYRFRDLIVYFPYPDPLIENHAGEKTPPLSPDAVCLTVPVSGGDGGGGFKSYTQTDIMSRAARLGRQQLKLDSEDRVLLTATDPLSMLVAQVACLDACSVLVVPSDPTDAKKVAALAEKEGVTKVIGGNAPSKLKSAVPE